MTDPEGAFYSTEDADSEGVEGKYYVWTLAEVNDVLGAERAKTFAYVYDVTAVGQLGRHRTSSTCRKPIAQAAKMLGRDEDELRAELAADRAELLAVRDRRVPPGKDTKVLASWNGLMIAALAEGGRDPRGRALPRRRRPRRRLHPRPDAAAPTAGCSTPSRTAGPGSTPTSTTTPT